MPTGYPTYLQVNANGTVTAIFSGGVLMPEIAIGGPPAYTAPSAIAWEDSTGTIREFIQGFVSGTGTHELDVVSQSDSTDIAALELQTQVLAAGGPGASRIYAVANAHGDRGGILQIIDSLQQSQYIQQTGRKFSPLRYGFINSDGTTGDAGSSDWSAVRNAAGDYTVTYSGSYPNMSFPVVTAFFNGVVYNFAILVNVSKSAFHILTTVPGGPPADAAFFFMVIGY
jgi:hypothetical protein